MNLKNMYYVFCVDIFMHVLFISEPTHTMDPEPGKTGQMNVLGLVVFSLATGIVLGKMGASGKPLIDFCASLNQVIMKLFMIFIW